MDNDPIISRLEEITDRIIFLRDRFTSADADDQEVAEQEFAALMLAVDETKENYRTVLELIHSRPK